MTNYGIIFIFAFSAISHVTSTMLFVFEFVSAIYKINFKNHIRPKHKLGIRYISNYCYCYFQIANTKFDGRGRCSVGAE